VAVNEGDGRISVVAVAVGVCPVGVLVFGVSTWGVDKGGGEEVAQADKIKIDMVRGMKER
jgi:hypothetical protein